MEGIAVQRAEEMPTPQMVNTTKWQLNPKAKEFLPLLPQPTKSLPPTPPPPPLPEHVVWHGGWFFSPPLPPPVLKPNFKYFPCPTPITTYSCCNFIPPVLKLPSTTQTTLPSRATVDVPPAKPGFIRNRLRSSRRRGMVGHRRPRTMRRRGCNLPKTTADCAWVEKDKKNDEQEVVEENSSALTPPLPPPPLPTASDDYCGYPFGRSTTCLMIRNIPVRLSRAKLMELLDEHCHEQNQKLKDEDEPPSEFDFLYLPIDFKRKGNKGYAFVNFTSWKGAARLFNCWDGGNWVGCGCTTRKICRFSRARFQGGEALKKHFQKSVFRCESEEYLPVEISPPRNGSNANITTLITIGTRLSLHR